MLDYTQHWVHYPFTNIRYRSSTLSTSISWIKSSYIQADFGIWHVLLLKPTSVAKTQRKIGGTEYSKRGGTENGYFPTKRKTSSVPPRRLCCTFPCIKKSKFRAFPCIFSSKNQNSVLSRALLIGKKWFSRAIF